jgi:hypothetical protein
MQSRPSSTNSTGKSVENSSGLTGPSILILSIVSPSSVQEAEHSLYQAEQMVEKAVETEISGIFGGGPHERQKPPIILSHDEDQQQRRDKSVDATEAMLKQDSSWVDGEKKLKKELKKLVELQKEGKFLGVPVLTRWLGPDIPAWPGEGVDPEEWQKKVDAKYAEMREEENKWREKVAQFMESGL